MRNRSNNLFLRITALCSLELLYFLWQPYPKSILLRTVCESGGRSDLITNIVFFVIQFFVLRKVFLNERAKERKKFTFRGVLTFFAIICEQLICDAVLIKTYDQQYFIFPIVCNLCSIVQWILIFLIMTWAYPDERRQWNKKRAKWCAAAIAIVFLAITMVIVFEQKQLNYLTEKLRDGSWRLEGYLMNARFGHQRLNMFMSMAASVSICSAIYYKAWKPNGNDRPIVYYIGQGLMRAMFILFAVGLLRFGKMVLLPQSTLMAYSSGGGKSYVAQSVYEDKKSSKYRQWCPGSYAVRTDANGQDMTVFSRERCEISYYGKYIYSFTYRGYDPHLHGVFGETEYLNEYNAAVFAKEEVAWAENDRVYHINIHDIDKQKENKTLIKICRRMIEGVDWDSFYTLKEYYDDPDPRYMLCAGDWDFFECTAGYLIKYDLRFIRPYIIRYAEGEFTEEELKQNSTIRPEYIQKIARELMDQI